MKKCVLGEEKKKRSFFFEPWGSVSSREKRALTRGKYSGIWPGFNLDGWGKNSERIKNDLSGARIKI